MARLLLLLIMAGFGLAGSPPRAAERAPAPAPKADPAPVSLEDLFKRLAAAKEEAEAKGIASLIERRWAQSGSDTADLLVSRALEAMRGKDFALAVELLDRVIALEPRWAEGWNRRATAFLLLDDPASAMADIQETIAREPRHYSAWSSLGQLYLQNGDKKRALEAFRRAQALHPFLSDVPTAIEHLRPEVEGRDL
jgi:Tfp pilus assembly protein PilF